MNFKYTNEDLAALSKQDPILGAYIKEVGHLARPLEKDLFKSLVRSIIAQQISIKAVKTIENRLNNLVSNITPQTINALDTETLQSIGITFRKAHYIKEIAFHFLEVDYDDLFTKTNEEIIEILTQFEGIGLWTAEMILLHTFERGHILSYQDLAIRRGMEKLYKIERLDKENFGIIKKRLRPYGSIASIYFWHLSKDES